MSDLALDEINKERGNGFFLSDKGFFHNYLSEYDKLFTSYRHQEINIFEVGYQHGGSATLWTKYFSKAIIKTIDIDHCVPDPSSSRIILEIQDIRMITSDYFNDFPPDIAIDDGSHLLDDQIYFIKTVYPVLRQNGLLIIEDIQYLENHRFVFESLGIPFEVFDFRKQTGRYDDVFLLYRK